MIIEFLYRDIIADTIWRFTLFLLLNKVAKLFHLGELDDHLGFGHFFVQKVIKIEL
ncbi:hypothetical protein [Streptococcus pluranimalium]|uniref:hypothetical protein n=1 Tax=Streptococcus pluranimalium TaxID=82348 RepID=UPI003F67ABE3